jgi:exportin-1
MACDTFIKIANKCKRHFVALQPGETEPFIEEIVRTMQKITIDLSPQQVHTFYEACGYMISAQGQKSTQERLIQELMSYPNQAVGDGDRWMCGMLTDSVGSNHRGRRS